MSLYYVDTSAVLKLLVEETDSRAFAAFYDKQADASWVSSALLRVEVCRTVIRALPDALTDAWDLLSAFDYIAIDDGVVEAAAQEPDPLLRSLDAIHLASARLVSSELTGVITYDDRLTGAAEAAGFPVVRPQG